MYFVKISNFNEKLKACIKGYKFQKEYVILQKNVNLHLNVVFDLSKSFVIIQLSINTTVSTETFAGSSCSRRQL